MSKKIESIVPSPTRGVMIPGLELIPESDFQHLSKLMIPNSSLNRFLTVVYWNFSLNCEKKMRERFRECDLLMFNRPYHPFMTWFERKYILSFPEWFNRIEQGKGSSEKGKWTQEKSQLSPNLSWALTHRLGCRRRWMRPSCDRTPCRWSTSCGRRASTT